MVRFSAPLRRACTSGAILAASAFCGAITVSAHAQTSSVAAPCEKAASKTTGPAWIHLTMKQERLVSLRPVSLNKTSLPLPIEDIVEFDGYLPADGSDIHINAGRDTQYVARASSTTANGKPETVSEAPGRVLAGVTGTFHALPDKDGNIVVTGDVRLTDDLAIAEAKVGNLSFEQARFKDVRFQPSVTVAGLHCVAPMQERTGNVRSDNQQAGPMVGVTILAERTQ
ncbi:hypothetical protein [Asaia sp. As-1742]|uniref:hypothetical protein n=1 Tax=Asaia sp. As-1742 TaxID=2608325 RepID=UPI00141DB71E|nr:hypothetical protein [Asaia sp. As-1742]NIE81448.1 hypothetical protein [Asaia sp. As-1742]